jgi:hypothetical protein
VPALMLLHKTLMIDCSDILGKFDYLRLKPLDLCCVRIVLFPPDCS